MNNNSPRLPCQPTDALPGTDEKFAVLCQRAENNQELFHPNDAKFTLRNGVKLRSSANGVPVYAGFVDEKELDQDDLVLADGGAPTQPSPPNFLHPGQ